MYSVIIITYIPYKEVFNSIYVRKKSCYYRELEKSVKDLVLRLSLSVQKALKAVLCPTLKKRYYHGKTMIRVDWKWF